MIWFFMTNKSRRKLSKLIGNNLVFVDENKRKTPGTWMYILNEDGENKHFFIPYNKELGPFRVPLHGENKVGFEFGVGGPWVYGSSDSYSRVANARELLELALFEGLLRLSDPLADVQGQGGPSLIPTPGGDIGRGLKLVFFLKILVLEFNYSLDFSEYTS